MLEILYVPFGFILRGLYNLVNNYGLALFFFTLLFRLVLLPSVISQQKGAAKQARLLPRVKKIQQKYGKTPSKEDRQKIAVETQELYKKEGYNAMTSGCSSMLLQLPIITGLIGVIYRPLSYVLNISKETVETITTAVKPILENMAASGGPKFSAAARDIEYKAIKYFDEILASGANIPADVADKIRAFDFKILGIPLGDTPAAYKDMGVSKWIILIPVISFLTSLLTAYLAQINQKKNNPQMASGLQGGCMMLFPPLMSLFFSFQFPAGLGIYWIMGNIITIVQTVVLNRLYSPKRLICKEMIQESIERASRENVLKEIK